MRHVEYPLVELIQAPPARCYQIPPWQRNYQWGLPQNHRFIYDVQKALSQPEKHWIGVALIGESEMECTLATTVAGHTCYQVLDGQQRLVSTRLWLLALSDEYKRQTGNLPPLYEDRNQLTELDVHALDQEQWQQISDESILSVNEYPESSGTETIRQTYLYFRYVILMNLLFDEVHEEVSILEANDAQSLIETWADSEEADPVTPEQILSLLDATVTKLNLTVLTHEPLIDEDVEIIFETINATRAELGQYDLFRNFVLIESGTQGYEQQSLYTKTLRDAEQKIKDMPRGFENNLDQNELLFSMQIQQSLYLEMRCCCLFVCVR